MPNICIFDICIQVLYTDSWEDIASIVLPNAREYAKRHSYNLHERRYCRTFSGFEKLEQIKRLFEGGYDIVWSIDCDAMITNQLQKVEDFLDDRNSLFICNDYNGINAGSFIIKKSEWSIGFLNECLSFEGMEDIYCEQDAFKKYIEIHGNEKIKYLSHPSINSYIYDLYPEIPNQSHEQGNWMVGDFVLHLPGISMDRRFNILNHARILK